MNRSWLRALLVASAAAAVLSACGGDSHNGGGSSADNGSDLPASATSSSSAFLAYMATLVATAGDTSEPLNLGTATVPTDDTADTVAN